MSRWHRIMRSVSMSSTACPQESQASPRSHGLHRTESAWTPRNDGVDRASMRLTTTLFGESFTFPSVKDALARANEPRSGDVQAGLAARSMREMAAAKRVVAELSLKELRENPSVPYETDEVTRVIEDDLDERAYKRVCGWSVAELREWILDDATTGEDVRSVTFG